MIRCYLQVEEDECAACCIAMIMSEYNIRFNLEEIKENISVSRDGVSMLAIKKYLCKKGFEVNTYSTNINGLYKLNTRAIILWEDNHYVILNKMKKNCVEIIDPKFGYENCSYKEFKEKYSGYALISKRQKKEKKENIILKYFRKLSIKKKTLFSLFLCSSIYYIFSIIQPTIIENIIENKISNISIIFAFILLYASTVYCLYMKKTIVGNKTYVEASDKFIKKIINLPLKFFQNHSVGNISFRIECLNIIRPIYYEYVLGIIMEIGMLVILSIYICIISKITYMLMLGVGSIVVCIMLIIISKLIRINYKVVKEENSYRSYYTEILGVMDTVKLFNLDSDISGEWKKQFMKVNQVIMNREKLQNIYTSIEASLNIVAPLLVVAINIRGVLKGEMTMGKTMALYTVSSSFFLSITAILRYISSIKEGNQYLDKIMEIEELSEQNKIENLEKIHDFKEVRLKNVDFMYNKYGVKTLERINLKIKKGQKVSVIGTSGAGKSTLLKIIAGLYNPTDGEVLFNEEKSGYIYGKSDMIGYIDANMVLFNRSIYYNIVLGEDDIGYYDVVNICKELGIYDEIQAMPMGFDTVVGERGNHLSSGQRQRIAFARILVRKPQILCLDEATNNLDAINETKVIEYLANHQITQIMVTHKLYLVKNSDVIIVLDDGKIVGKGTHKELINSCEIYSKIKEKELV